METTQSSEVEQLRAQIAALQERLAGVDGSTDQVSAVRLAHASLNALPGTSSQFEAILNSSPVMISYIGTDSRFRWVNRMYAEFYGVERSHFIGRSITELAGDEHGRKALPHFEQALAGQRVRYESFVADRNGERKPIQILYVPQFGETGTVEGVVATVEDISPRKQTEDSLREDAQRFRTLAETVPQLVWTSRPDGYCDYLSSQWVEYAGIPEAQLLGNNWLLKLVHPDDRDRTFEAWQAAIAQRAPYDVEYRLLRRDGIYRWFKVRGTPLRHVDNTILEWFGTCTDIHDERTREQERQEQLIREQKGRASAELLNRIGPLLVSELDPQKLVEKITNIATELIHAEFGTFYHAGAAGEPNRFQFRTLSGAPVAALDHLPTPANDALLAQTFEHHLVVRCHDVTQDARFDFPADGTAPSNLAFKSYLAVPVIARSGVAHGCLLFGHSEAGRFSEQDEDLIRGIAAQAAVALDNAQLFAQSQEDKHKLLKANQELKSAITDLEQFASAAAHDLQEPLRMVTSYTQLLQRAFESLLDTKTEEYMGYVVNGAKRMSLLLQDLLAYSEASRSLEVPFAPVELDRVLEQSLANLAPSLESPVPRLPRSRCREFSGVSPNTFSSSKISSRMASSTRRQGSPLPSASALRSQTSSNGWSGLKIAVLGSTRSIISKSLAFLSAYTVGRYPVRASVWRSASEWWRKRAAGSGLSRNRVKERHSASHSPEFPSHLCTNPDCRKLYSENTPQSIFRLNAPCMGSKHPIDIEDVVKIARFVEASKELFYYITGLTMLCRHCESLEEAERMVACSGVSQQVFRV